MPGADGWVGCYPGMSEGLAVTTVVRRVSGCDWRVALLRSRSQNVDKRLKQISHESSYPLNKVNSFDEFEKKRGSSFDQ